MYSAVYPSASCTNPVLRLRNGLKLATISTILTLAQTLMNHTPYAKGAPNLLFLAFGITHSIIWLYLKSFH
jgi:uncharacterized integral membrane protein